MIHIIVLSADKNRLTVREKEPITGGSVNVYPVRFEFSPDWDGLEKTAVFQAGREEKSVCLVSGACTVPEEVLSAAGYFLMAGVCGRAGDTVVLPTVWANLGLILEGAVPSGEPDPPPAGTADHRVLRYRDAADQHPIGAITGLASEIARIPTPVESISNAELEEILK